jgi:hypothetical protein
MMTLRLFSIGDSQEGRPLTAYVVEPRAARARVLVVAGQHGDEPEAVRAARALVHRLGGPAHPPGLAVAVVPCLNPDGAAARRRAAADGADLNRGHLLLATPETQALHRFARAWRPTLVLDLHTYPPRRRSLRAHGLAHAADLLADTPTHPAVTDALGADRLDGLRDAVLDGVRAAGLRAGRYTLLTPSGRLRHSTPDVVDLRNGLALRLGVPTLRLEGRAPTPRVPGATATRTARAFHAALDEVLRAALADRPRPSACREVPVRPRAARGGARPVLPMLDLATGAVAEVALPGRYRTPLGAGTVRLPAAYAVDARARAVLDVLARHGLVGTPGTAAGAAAVAVLAATPSGRAARPPRRLVLGGASVATGRPVVVFPAAGPAGRALAVWLEPTSRHGLSRFLPDALPLAPGSVYPVLRLPTLPEPCVPSVC